MSLQYLPADRAAIWTTRLVDAELYPPSHFTNNGWVVEALQGAWSAIKHTPVPKLDPATDSYPCDHLRVSLEAAVRGGNDTDTVAAIAGGLLGAAWGASAVPARWRRVIHGWPGRTSRDLVRYAALSVTGGENDGLGWPEAQTLAYRESRYGDVTMLAQHPNDPGVVLGGAANVTELPRGVDAVVSLCRIGRAVSNAIAIPDLVEVRLMDNADPAKNPNLDFVLADAADAVAAFRAEGKTVLLHCVQAISRTPTVAALYAARHLGVPAESSLAQIQAVLALAEPNRAFCDILRSTPTREAASQLRTTNTNSPETTR